MPQLRLIVDKFVAPIVGESVSGRLTKEISVWGVSQRAVIVLRQKEEVMIIELEEAIKTDEVV